MNKLLIALCLTFTLSGCFLLRPPPDIAAVEQQIAELREYREAAVKAGLSAELVAQIDGVLGESQEHLRLIREQQPSNGLDLILLGAGALAGAGVFGAKAVAAAKWIHEPAFQLTLSHTCFCVIDDFEERMEIELLDGVVLKNQMIGSSPNLR